MTERKRDRIKYVRDRVKSKYDKKDKCEICDSTDRLEFHHYYSLTLLFNKFLKENGLKADTVEEVTEAGTLFIAGHQKEIYEDTVTLCHHHHHERLHSGIYGKTPSLHTASKQKKWVRIMRQKFLDGKKV